MEKNYKDDTSFEFIVNCLNQNLEHVRHVEMERMTFNSIFLALVAGALAVMSNATHSVTIVICVLVLLENIVVMTLTHRWNQTIKKHSEYAKKCFSLTQSDYLKNSIANQELYFFEFEKGIVNIGKYQLRTKSLFFGFQLVILAGFGILLIFRLT